MNHDQFKKCIGQTLRLEPRAIGPSGRMIDLWTPAPPILHPIQPMYLERPAI